VLRGDEPHLPRLQPPPYHGELARVVKTWNDLPAAHFLHFSYGGSGADDIFQQSITFEPLNQFSKT